MVRSSGPALDEDVIVYSYKKEPYTGPIANYDKNGKLLMEGQLKNGLADSTFTFYFNSGGVQMKGNYVAGKDLGLWQSFYGYDKVKIEKLYNDKGYLIERKEYYSNGQLKNYQKIRVKTELTEDGRSSEITADNKIAHSYDDKERIVSYDRRGNLESIYVEDSIKWEKGQ